MIVSDQKSSICEHRQDIDFIIEQRFHLKWAEGKLVKHSHNSEKRKMYTQYIKDIQEIIEISKILYEQTYGTPYNLLP